MNFLAFLPLLFPLQQDPSTLYIEKPGELEFSDRMIVRPWPLDEFMEMGLSRSEAVSRREASFARVSDRVVKELELNGEVVVDLQGEDPNQFGAALLATGDYHYVHPDWICYPVGNVPNDPLYNQQWHHQNMFSEDAWDLHTGDLGHIAAVIDTGVDTDHEDLAARLLPGYNSEDGLTEAQGGDIEDINGHGTWCHGCVGAIGNNGKGVAGMCWEVSLLPIRASNSANGSAYLSALTGGCLWAVQNGARTMSCSYSGVETPSVGTTGTSVKALGGIVCWAAGNSGTNHSSWDWPDIVVCGATNPSDNKTSWSSYGLGVDVFAPGESIMSTQNGGGYSAVSGTSFSTPLTNGTLALMWSANPGLSADDVQQALYDTCTSMGDPITYGHGLVNAYEGLLEVGVGGQSDLESLEAFVYTVDQPLDGNDGGDGWGGPWTADSTVEVKNPSLGSNPADGAGLFAEGGRALISGVGSASRSLNRSFPMDRDGFWYMSMRVRRDDTGTTPSSLSVGLASGGQVEAQFGWSASTAWGAGGQVPDSGVGSANSGSSYFIVVRVNGAPDATGIIKTVENPATGNTYHLLSPRLWDDAEAAGVSLGGHLATVNDAAENAWLYDNFVLEGGAERRVWHGLNDIAVENQWEWTSGEAVTYIDWAPGQPNNLGNGQDRVHFYEGDGGGGHWNDHYDNEVYLAVVEVPGTGHSIPGEDRVNLKVFSSGDSVPADDINYSGEGTGANQWTVESDLFHSSSILDSLVIAASGGDSMVSLDEIRIGKTWASVTRPIAPFLQVSDLVAGQTGSLDVSGATSGATVGFGYSLTGGGPTSSPWGNLSLSPPVKTAGIVAANASGEASLQVIVPTGTSGIAVWIQAVRIASGFGVLSNPVEATVQ